MTTFIAFWLQKIGRYLTPFPFLPLLSHNTFPFFSFYLLLFSWRFYLFIIRKRRREGEREGETHKCVVASPTPPTGPTTQACALTGNWTGDPLLCSGCSIHWATPARASLPFYNFTSTNTNCPRNNTKTIHCQAMHVTRLPPIFWWSPLSPGQT